MKNFTAVCVLTNLGDLATALVCSEEVTPDKLIDFVMQLEEYVCDIDFTVELANRLNAVIEAERD